MINDKEFLKFEEGFFKPVTAVRMPAAAFRDRRKQVVSIICHQAEPVTVQVQGHDVRIAAHDLRMAGNHVR